MASYTRRHAVTPVLVEFPPVWGEDNRMMSKCLKCVVFLLLVTALRVGAQGTAFTYQGDLATNGTPATGAFDFRFAVYDAVTNGNLVSILLTNAPVGVTNGLFTTTLDFGSNVFTGPARWLDLGVRTNGATSAYTGLFPRQPVTAVPYAIFAGGASNLLGALQATQLSGTISSAQITGTYTNTVNFTNGSNAFIGSFAGAFAGNGSGVTNLNGSQISTGTVADARLSTNVAFLNGNQTFSGANTMSNWNNSFTGNFYGNGLVGWNTVSSNTINAVIDHGYVLTNASLVTVALPGSANVGDIIRIAGAGTAGWQVNLAASNQSILGSFYTYNTLTWNRSGAISGNWQCLASSADGSRLVAGIYGGSLYTSVDYGTTWNPNSPLSSANWRAVASSADGTRLLAGVYSGSLYLSTNSGSTWSTVTGSSGYNWTAAACSTDGSHLIAVASGGIVYLSSNYGVTWSTATTGLPSTPAWQCVASSASGANLIAGIGSGTIYYSVNSGSSWTASSAANLNWYSLAASADGNRVVASAAGSGMYISYNAGATWTQLANAPAGTCYGVAASSDCSKMVTGVNGGRIYLSGNLGNTWIPQTVAPNTNWFAATMSSDGSHVAVAASGTSPIGVIYNSISTPQVITATYTNGIYGSQGCSAEFQCIGTNKFMPVSSAGFIWGY